MVKIFLAFLIILSVSSPGLTDSLGEQEKNFLEEHSQEIKLGEADFPLLENQLDNHSIFLLGKNHGLEVNTRLQMDLLKFFHQKAGVRYLVIEATYSMGEFINKFLETGEEEYLELIISYWRRSQEKFDFFRDLKEYNSEFPEEEQIRVVGVDVQGPPRTLISINYLGNLLTDRHIPLELEYHLLPLVSLAQDFMELRQEEDHPRKAQTEYQAGIPDEMIKKTREATQNILEHWEKNSEPYEEFLENPPEFYLVLNNIIDAFIMEEKLQEGLEASQSYRSERAFHNFLDFSKGLEGEKFFAHWDELSVLQKPFRGVERFGARLAGPESPFHGEVLSLWCVYFDSHQMQAFSPGEIVDFNSEYIVKNMESLVELSLGNATLFQLKKEGSPFAEKEYFLTEESNYSSAEIFQFLILLKDSPPENPFYLP